jgi:hypothetical protein
VDGRPGLDSAVICRAALEEHSAFDLTGELYFVFIEVVLCLLRHCEGAGHRNLDHAVGISTQERHITDLDWTAPAYAADNTRHGIRVPAAIQCCAGIVDVDAFQGRRKAV